MKCPKCHGDLVVKLVGEIEIEECPGCKGSWCSSEELRRLKDLTDSDLNWMDFDMWKKRDALAVTPTSLTCPTCNVPLYAIDYDKTGVEVDICSSCKGVWLDKGEFAQILAALENELLQKPTSEYLKATLEEAKEIVTGPESLLSEWKDFLTVLRMLQYRILSNNPQLHEALVSAQKSTPIK